MQVCGTLTTLSRPESQAVLVDVGGVSASPRPGSGYQLPPRRMLSNFSCYLCRGQTPLLHLPRDLFSVHMKPACPLPAWACGPGAGGLEASGAEGSELAWASSTGDALPSKVLQGCALAQPGPHCPTWLAWVS